MNRRLLQIFWDGQRIRTYSWIFVAVYVITYVVWLAVSLPNLVDPRGGAFGNDFLNFWAAARLALSGSPLAAYDLTSFNEFERSIVPATPELLPPWGGPPAAILIYLPVALLPYPIALAAFMLSTAALWAALVRRVLPDRRMWIVAAAAPAGFITVVDGQSAFLTASIAGFALIWLNSRPVWSGLLLGLLAMKPHLGVLFPLALLAERRWVTLAAAAAMVLALNVASAAVFGPRIFAAFVQHIPVMEYASPGQLPTIYVFARSVGLSTPLAALLQTMTALFAAGSVWRIWRDRNSIFQVKSAALVSGSLLVSPYLAHYDLTWAALSIGWLAVLGLQTGFYPGEREILLLTALTPVLVPLIYVLTSVQVGFVALLLLHLAACRRSGMAREGVTGWPR